MDKYYKLYNNENIEHFCQEEYNIFLLNFKNLIINYYNDNSIIKDIITIYNIEDELKNAYETFKLTNLETNFVKTFIFNKILNKNKNLI